MRRPTLKQTVAVAKVIYANRKAEIAIATSVAAIAREIVQALTGH